MHQFLSDSNNLADFNNVNKEFLPKIPPKQILQKNPTKKSCKKILQKKSSKKSYKKNPTKKSSKKFPKKIPPKNSKNFQTVSQKVPSFENIQFPTSHLEAENPFGLVFIFYLDFLVPFLFELLFTFLFNFISVFLFTFLSIFTSPILDFFQIFIRYFVNRPPPPSLRRPHSLWMTPRARYLSALSLVAVDIDAEEGVE
jgi:hypothetical protein